ncbi:MAG: VTT domain-containing protein [Gammaproteobacteria bacterium]|nr:VTT domain-containing protein [Gammaproteobacteria bacterium]
MFTTIKRWFLLTLLLILLVSFFYFDLHHYLTYETLKKYQTFATQWTAQHYFQATVLYILVFTLLIACAVPCATFLTLLGGFLLGTIAIPYAVFATTFGGLILCLAVRMSVGAGFTTSTGVVKRFERGFKRNAFMYILMLRLVPIFPCWISNVSAGALNVPLKTFIAATVLGVFPATFVYAMVGRGLGKVFEQDTSPSYTIIFTPSILLPLIAMIIISLLPIIYHFIKRK